MAEGYNQQFVQALHHTFPFLLVHIKWSVRHILSYMDLEFYLVFTPRLPKSYKQQSLSVTKERETNPFIFTKDESLVQDFGISSIWTSTLQCAFVPSIH